MAGLLGGYDPLAGLLGPATNTDPLAAYLGVDPAKARLSAIGDVAGGLSDALLYRGPRKNSGGIAGAIGQLGSGLAAGGTAAVKGQQERLATDLLKKQALTKMQDEDYARQQAKEEDQAIATWVAGLPPDVRKWVSDNPELGKEAYKQAMQKVFDTSGGTDANGNPRYSTTPRSVWNEKTQQYEDWQPSTGGGAKQIDYGEGRSAVPPGAATIEGTKFKSFEENQHAVTTSLTNIAEVPDLIDQIRADKDLAAWGTGYAAVALNDLSPTHAAAIKNRTEQLKAISLFTKIPELKGMGALSNVEGDTAAKAMFRADNATSYAEYMSAINDYEEVMGRVFERNQRMSQSGDWSEMDKIRRENNAALKFVKRPPTISQEDWNSLSKAEKLEVFDAYKAGLPK